MKPRRLSALVVSYRSGAYAVGCVRSLQHAWRAEGRDPADLEVVVVDNASPTDESAHLAELRELGARVIEDDENRGYAGGMNRALRETSGGPDDVVAALNPDLAFPPGSLGPLLEHLERDPRCGAVAPRTTIDPLGEIHISRDLLPTPLEQTRITLARMHPALCRAYGRRRLRLALEWWLSDGPLETDMITGCCLFLRRAVIEELGELLDEGFPLYFEDTDLYHRLRKRGYSVVRHGGSHVLHHWSRSARVGEGFGGEVMRRYYVGIERYFSKHYGAWGWSVVKGLMKLEERWPAQKLHRPMHEVEELGDFEEPITLTLPRACPFVLELGLQPTWIVTVGIVGEGDRWTCPSSTWEWFFATDYYVRAFDRSNGDYLGAWHFRKTTPGRDHPLSSQELDPQALGDPVAP